MLRDYFCMICGDLITVERYTLRLSDNGRFNYDIIGHNHCTKRVQDDIRALKNLDKLTTSKALEAIGLDLNLEDIKV